MGVPHAVPVKPALQLQRLVRISQMPLLLHNVSAGPTAHIVSVQSAPSKPWEHAKGVGAVVGDFVGGGVGLAVGLGVGKPVGPTAAGVGGLGVGGGAGVGATMHALWPICPPVYKPRAHVVHTVPPESPWKWPAGHATQPELPALGWTLPTEHGRHAPAPAVA